MSINSQSLKFPPKLFLEALLSKIIRRGPQVVLTVHPCTTGKLVKSSVDARKKTISFFSMAVSAVLGWILPGVYQPDTLVRPSAQLKANTNTRNGTGCSNRRQLVKKSKKIINLQYSYLMRYDVMVSG